MKRTEDSLVRSLPQYYLCPACAELWGLRSESNQAPAPGSSQSGESGVVLCNFKH